MKALYSAPITPVRDESHCHSVVIPRKFQPGEDRVKSGKLSRRQFLEVALAAAAASGIGVACGRNGTPWRFFSIDEAQTLAAISDQIIPADQDPGASWAGVVNYIDRQLCGPFQNLQDAYRSGLAAVNQSSQLAYGKKFIDLDSHQQTELLQRFERERSPGAVWQRITSSDFFSMLIDHTMQGYYGDPRHGGNRDAVSWKMLGLPYPPIRGRQGVKATKA